MLKICFSFIFLYTNYEFFESLFINYLYHVDGVNTITSLLEYMTLNLDNKFPDAMVSKHSFSLLDLI